MNAALNGELDDIEVRRDPIFGFEVPARVSGVPLDVLDPKKTWSNPSDYDVQARKLAVLFNENFDAFKAQTPDKVFAAGPKIN